MSTRSGVRLERGPRDVPLEQVDGAARAVRGVGEPVEQETLAGPGQPGEEHEAGLRESLDQSGERRAFREEVAHGLLIPWRTAWIVPHRYRMRNTQPRTVYRAFSPRSVTMVFAI